MRGVRGRGHGAPPDLGGEEGVEGRREGRGREGVYLLISRGEAEVYVLMNGVGRKKNDEGEGQRKGGITSSKDFWFLVCSFVLCMDVGRPPPARGHTDLWRGGRVRVEYNRRRRPLKLARELQPVSKSVRLVAGLNA